MAPDLVPSGTICICSVRLPLLETRRRQHIVDLVERAMTGHTHPALKDYFRREGEADLVTGDCLARVGAGRKRFRVHGALVYNECRSTFAGGLPLPAGSTSSSGRSNGSALWPHRAVIYSSGFQSGLSEAKDTSLQLSSTRKIFMMMMMMRQYHIPC